jgi:hypothetical protein
MVNDDVGHYNAPIRLLDLVTIAIEFAIDIPFRKTRPQMARQIPCDCSLVKIADEQVCVNIEKLLDGNEDIVA